MPQLPYNPAGMCHVGGFRVNPVHPILGQTDTDVQLFQSKQARLTSPQSAWEEVEVKVQPGCRDGPSGARLDTTLCI